jgi:hypothetical protein
LISSQFSSNHILITGGIAGAVLQSLLILFNQSFFSESADLQPVSENSRTEPSECRHVAKNFIADVLSKFEKGSYRTKTCPVTSGKGLKNGSGGVTPRA